MEIEKVEATEAYYVGTEERGSVRIEVTKSDSTGKVTRVTVTGTELTALEVWAIIKLWENGKIPLPDF